MLLFVGLGNPGPKHAANRHNIGFMAVQAIARRHNLSPWRRRFQGVAVEGNIANERALLLLPGTYMNESGRAVAEAVHFYKLEPGNVAVFQQYGCGAEYNDYLKCAATLASTASNWDCSVPGIAPTPLAPACSDQFNAVLTCLYY